MMMRREVFVLLAISVAFVSTSHAAVLIDSFEGDINWTTDGDTIAPGTVGVTDGVASLQRDFGAGWKAIDLDISGLIDELNANDTLLVDVTTSNTAESVGWWLETAIVLQGGIDPSGDYYNQSGLTSVASPDGSLITTTVAYNYAPGLTSGPVVNWAKFRIINNTNGDGTVYYDNMRLVPEPATLSLLGLGGVALLRRRRK